jgi:hypothetical protein
MEIIMLSRIKAGLARSVVAWLLPEIERQRAALPASKAALEWHRQRMRFILE